MFALDLQIILVFQFYAANDKQRDVLKASLYENGRKSIIEKKEVLLKILKLFLIL